MPDDDNDCPHHPGRHPAGYCCGARSRQGRRCVQRAGWGTTHIGIGACKLHGGSTPNHQIAAARRLTDQRAQELLAEMGNPEPVEDVYGELLGLAGQMKRFSDVMYQMVSELERVGYAGQSGEQVKAEVFAFLKAAERAESILVNISKLNLEERRVRLNEAQATLVYELGRRALAAIGLGEHQEAFRAAFRAEAAAALPAGTR